MDAGRLNRRWLAAGLGGLVLIGGAGAATWYFWPQAARESAGGDAARKGTDGLDAARTDVVTMASAQRRDTAGATPMNQRVAVLGLLNKRNGETRDITLKPGQAVRAGPVIVRLRACEVTAPWEPDQYTGAFVQLDVQNNEGKWGRAFSGWLFKERPALNVVQHPIYDVWPKSCAMTLPGAEAPATPKGGDSRSSAPKSADTDTGDDAPGDGAPAPAPSPSDNAAASNPE